MECDEMTLTIKDPINTDCSFFTSLKDKEKSKDYTIFLKPLNKEFKFHILYLEYYSDFLQLNERFASGDKTFIIDESFDCFLFHSVLDYMYTREISFNFYHSFDLLKILTILKNENLLKKVQMLILSNIHQEKQFIYCLTHVLTVIYLNNPESSDVPFISQVLSNIFQGLDKSSFELCNTKALNMLGLKHRVNFGTLKKILENIPDHYDFSMLFTKSLLQFNFDKEKFKNVSREEQLLVKNLCQKWINNGASLNDLEDLNNFFPNFDLVEFESLKSRLIIMSCQNLKEKNEMLNSKYENVIVNVNDKYELLSRENHELKVRIQALENEMITMQHRINDIDAYINQVCFNNTISHKDAYNFFYSAFQRHFHFKTLFDSEIEGFNEANLKQKIKDKSNILYVIKLKNGRIFGGFQSIEMKDISTDHYEKDINAFLYDVELKEILKANPNMNQHFHVIPGYYLLIGNTYNSDGIYLSSTLLSVNNSAMFITEGKRFFANGNISCPIGEISSLMAIALKF